MHSDSTVGSRLLEAINEKFPHGGQAECARRLGMHPQQVHKYVSDQHMPSGEILIKMSTLLDVSIDWILKGDARWRRVDEPSAERLKSAREQMQALIDAIPDHLLRGLLPVLEWLHHTDALEPLRRDDEADTSGTACSEPL